MTTKPQELMRCPFCGGEGLLSDDDDEAGEWRTYWVRCTACRSDGAVQGSAQAAVDAWNTRHFGSPYSQKASNEIGASAKAAPTEASGPTIHNDSASIKPAG